MRLRTYQLKAIKSILNFWCPQEGKKSCPLLTCPSGCNSGMLKADMEFKTPLWWPLRLSHWRLLYVFVSGERSSEKFPLLLSLCCIFLSVQCFRYGSIPASKAESSSAFMTTPFLLKCVQQWAQLRSYVVYQFKIC